MATEIRAIFFDTLGTLWHPEPDPARRAVERCLALGREVSLPDVRYHRVRLQDELWARFSDGRCTSEERARAYWLDFYTRLAQALEVPAEKIPEMARALLEDQFDSGSYRLYPDVVPALEHLHRQPDRTLGVLCNRDGPDRDLLRAFGLGDLLTHCIVSSEVGVEKPDSRIFHLAAAACGIPPESLVYVGDDLLEDMTGALVAGSRPVLVDRAGRYSTNYLQWRRVRNLGELGALLDVPSPVPE